MVACKLPVVYIRRMLTSDLLRGRFGTWAAKHSDPRLAWRECQDFDIMSWWLDCQFPGWRDEGSPYHQWDAVRGRILETEYMISDHIKDIHRAEAQIRYLRTWVFYRQEALAALHRVESGIPVVENTEVGEEMCDAAFEDFLAEIASLSDTFVTTEHDRREAYDRDRCDYLRTLFPEPPGMCYDP